MMMNKIFLIPIAMLSCLSKEVESKFLHPRRVRGARKLQRGILEVDEAVRKHNHSSEKCGGKGYATCEPSAQPSPAPSPSPSLSVKPSSTPTGSPSANPTLSTRPSISPTAAPSVTPTTSPSAKPSETPTLSAVPSVSPSDRPTGTPSATPSVAPSISLAPTIQVYETLIGAPGEKFVSTCVADVPASGGALRDQTLAFQYNLYLAVGSDTTLAKDEMEYKIHHGMAKTFMTCTVDLSKSFTVWSIDSNPADTLDANACDVSNDPPVDGNYTCVVVTSELSLEAFFYTGGRQLQETAVHPDVLDATGEYLQQSMLDGEFEHGAILQTTFQGFLNVQLEGGTLSGGSASTGGVAQANQGAYAQPPTDNAKIATGVAVVALAAVILTVLIIFAVRRRKSRQEEFLHHLDNISDASELEIEQPRNIILDDKVELVNQEEEPSEGDSLDDIIVSLSALDPHDVHQCSSATCVICQQGVKPTFLSTTGRSVRRRDLEDLQRSPSITHPRPSYDSPDTVAL